MSVPQTGGMRAIYVDYVPRWVPVVSGLLIVAGAWFGGNLAHFDLQTTTTFAIFLFGALIVLVFFQGRYYWRGQIKTLSTDGMRYEALTSVWIGAGRRLAAVDNRIHGTGREDVDQPRQPAGAESRCVERDQSGLVP
jgi:hypothetical protein